MDITLTLSPITPFDVQFDTPSPSPLILGHPIPWNLLEAHGDSSLCCIHNRTLIFGLRDELQCMFSHIEYMLSQPPPPNSPPPPSLSPNKTYIMFSHFQIIVSQTFCKAVVVFGVSDTLFNPGGVGGEVVSEGELGRPIADRFAVAFIIFDSWSGVVLVICVGLGGFVWGVMNYDDGSCGDMTIGLSWSCGYDSVVAVMLAFYMVRFHEATEVSRGHGCWWMASLVVVVVGLRRVVVVGDFELFLLEVWEEGRGRGGVGWGRGVWGAGGTSGLGGDVGFMDVSVEVGLGCNDADSTGGFGLDDRSYLMWQLVGFILFLFLSLLQISGCEGGGFSLSNRSWDFSWSWIVGFGRMKEVGTE
ncbi:hypothetical protein Tco_0138521 [Tanacetum coccineum]